MRSEANGKRQRVPPAPASASDAVGVGPRGSQRLTARRACRCKSDPIVIAFYRVGASVGVESP
jgi:hypothetical protein